MSQITLQGKQQALMRVAASRVAVLDAVDSTRQHTARCVRALPVAPATLMKLGAVVGSAATVVGTLAGLRKRRRTAEKRAAGSASATSLIQLVWQLLAPTLFPLLQQALQRKMSSAGNPGRNSMF